MKTRKAFTLVELLVVIAILAILGTVSIVGYTSFTTKSKLSNDENLVTQWNTLLNCKDVIEEKLNNVVEVQDFFKSEGSDKFTPLSKDMHFYWNEEDNRVYLVNDTDGLNVVYPNDETITLLANKSYRLDLDTYIVDYFTKKAYSGPGLYDVNDNLLKSLTLEEAGVDGKKLQTTIGDFYDADLTKKIILPEGMTMIYRSTFGTVPYHTTCVILPNSLTELDETAFQIYFSDLTGLVLPHNLSKIGSKAFCSCSSLKDFVYKGTKAEWNAITKLGTGIDAWDYGTPDYTIHCTDGDILKTA